MVAAACPRCGSVVALHEGRAVVGADLKMVRWHRHCWDARDIPQRPVAAYALLADPPRYATKMIAGAIVMSALCSLGMAEWSWDEIAPPPPASLAPVDISVAEPVALRAAYAAHEERPAEPIGPETSLEAWLPIPELDGKPVDDKFPTVRNWVHPVTASKELVPAETPRQFGQPRIAILTPRPDCGQGHCGIDLDGPRGQPVVAVADGVVVTIETSELGRDGMSGRYVRIRHPDGTFTSYMHLDTIADNLQYGDHVVGGEYIGTLGATATFSAPPHLHFALEVPKVHDNDYETWFLDPAPFLARATIIPAPDRRKPQLPAF